MDEMKIAIDESRSLKQVIPNIFLNFKNVDSNQNVRILILNTPCNGFGDLIFGMKLANYLKEWYPKSKVDIATTLPDGLIKLGFDKNSIIQLGRNTPQCRRFRNLDIVHYKSGRKYTNSPQYDLLFVAPLAADFDVSRQDVKALFPYSNKFNTFFFSEYNDTLSKDFDFPTGIGRGRMGLLLTDTKPSKKRIVKEDYALVYIAQTIYGSFQCFESFYKMLEAKYPKKSFSIVVPKWIVEEAEKRGFKTRKNIKLRGDVLPVSNQEMITLMYHSMNDILLTGDQSITDALSCCPKKNIFYQIASWKENFGYHLANKLPDEYLQRKKTSCGTIKALDYRSDYSDFVEEWDFRVMARPMIDGIVNYTSKSKRSKRMRELEEDVMNSRSLSALKEKIDL